MYLKTRASCLNKLALFNFDILFILFVLIVRLLKGAVNLLWGAVNLQCCCYPLEMSDSYVCVGCAMYCNESHV